jgi:hypothetical protein
MADCKQVSRKAAKSAKNNKWRESPLCLNADNSFIQLLMCPLDKTYRRIK